jgi:hypothetical protein
MNLSNEQLDLLRGAIQSIEMGDAPSAKIKIRKAIEAGDPLLQTTWPKKHDCMCLPPDCCRQCCTHKPPTCYTHG